jgi:cytoskeletal protein RodZ
MKEIGLQLKQKREENGVSLEEAAQDLQMRASQLESIEEGRKEDFKDVFSLKYFIRDYAKYLGLDGEEMLDSFNEYLFEETSKISLEDIEEAKKKKEESEKDMKILSPYTLTKKDKKVRKIVIAAVLLLIIVMVCIYLSVRNKGGNDDFVESKLSYVGDGINEFSE